MVERFNVVSISLIKCACCHAYVVFCVICDACSDCGLVNYVLSHYKQHKYGTKHYIGLAASTFKERSN